VSEFDPGQTLFEKHFFKSIPRASSYPRAVYQWLLSICYSGLLGIRSKFSIASFSKITSNFQILLINNTQCINTQYINTEEALFALAAVTGKATASGTQLLSSSPVCMNWI
jgi:hypothetical protein